MRAQAVVLATVLTSPLYSIALLGCVLLRHFATLIDGRKFLWAPYIPFTYCLGLLLPIHPIPDASMGRGIPSLAVVFSEIAIFACLIHRLYCSGELKIPIRGRALGNGGALPLSLSN